MKYPNIIGREVENCNIYWGQREKRSSTEKEGET